jgi:hypothetical protein
MNRSDIDWTQLPGVLLVLAGACVGILTLLGAGVSAKGPSRCVGELQQRDSSFFSEHIVTRTMWTRSENGRWLTAIVVEPKDLSRTDQVTVVCYFQSDNYRFSRLETHDGDRTAKLKGFTRGPFNLYRIGEGW